MARRAALIFGGTTGIGSAVAKALIKDRFSVSVFSSNNKSVCDFLDSVLSESPSAGKVLGLVCDVTDERAVQKAVAVAHDTHGPAHILVNAAGINRDALLLKTRVEDMGDVISTNLIGPMITCKAVLRHMLRQKDGCIINIGSVVGSVGNAGQCVYSASKSGLVGFTKSLAQEVRDRGIRVNLLAPGFIRTGMTMKLSDPESLGDRIPMKRLGEPEEVVQVVRYLIHAQNVTGQVIYVDGGLHVCH